MGTGSSTVAVDQLTQVVDTASRAYSSKDWALGAAAALMLAVLLVRQFKLTDKVPSAVVPWATAGLAMATSVSLGIQNGQSWVSIITTGLTVGLSAVGLWETAGKVPGQIQQARAAAKAAPASAPEPPKEPPASP